MSDNHIIDDLQGANQQACSSLDTSWVVRETISHYRERNAEVYVGLMDVAKAFDSVWHNGLFYKLYNAGMDGKLWRILRELYKNFQC